MKTNKKQWVILTLCSLCLALLPGCSSFSLLPSSQSTGETSSWYQPQTPADGSAPPSAEIGEGELRLSMPASSSLLPWEVKNQEVQSILYLMMDPLWTLKPGGHLEGVLAKSWSFSEEADRLYVTLEQDRHFQNEELITSYDVAYTVEKLKSTANVFRENLLHIQSVEIEDNLNFAFVFEEAGLFNEEYLVFPLLPYGYENGQYPAGAGPYQVESFSKDEISLIAWKDYPEGAARLEKVRIFQRESGESGLDYFDSGRTNLYASQTPPWGLYGNEKEKTLHGYLSFEALYLEFTSEAYFDTLSDRQKIAYAIDAKGMMQQVLRGRGKISESLIRPESWYSTDMEQVYYPYDPDLSAKISFTKEGVLRLRYNAGSEIEKLCAEYIRENLTKAGLSVNLVTMGGCELSLKREKLSLEDILEKMGKLSMAKSVGKREEAFRELLREGADETAQTLPYYGLFYLEGAGMSGYGIRGNLAPCQDSPYNGVAALYILDTGGLEP